MCAYAERPEGPDHLGPDGVREAEWSWLGSGIVNGGVKRKRANRNADGNYVTGAGDRWADRWADWGKGAPSSQARAQMGIRGPLRDV